MLAHATAAPSAFAESDVPTVNAVIEEKRSQLKAKTEEQSRPAEKKQSTSESQPKTESQSTVFADGSPAALEEEAGQEGAFNPETGEINWDCPCLGGMAHGPCGEEFKTAFSCFVYSNEEPKGMDCIEKFQ
jgi:intermembrane space import and assembly protein 40